jgi:hypothetical protein
MYEEPPAGLFTLSRTGVPGLCVGLASYAALVVVAIIIVIVVTDFNRDFISNAFPPVANDAATSSPPWF